MRFTKTTLQNGVRVITVPMKGNPTVTVLVNIATGAYYETPEQSGISHFLEHMCFKGTSKRPSSRDITIELDSIGAAYNAFTTNEVTGFYAKADVKHFEDIGDIVADIYINSTFPEAEIAKEKGVVLGEIDMYRDDPQERVHDALREHMYGGEPAGRDILGTKETVRAITRGDLIAYHNLHYTPRNTIVTIAGGIDEALMLEWAKNTFGAAYGGEAGKEFLTKDREQAAPETVLLEKDTDQSHIVLAWRTFDRRHPDRFVAHLIKNVLRGGMSSRLFAKLRDEMGAGYYIGASGSSYNSFGNFSIYTGTTAERVPEIIGATLGEVARLKSEPVSDAELHKVREFIKAHTIMSLETSDSMAEFFADQEILSDKMRTPEEFEGIFSIITAEDIMRVAGLMFDNRKLTVAAIGKGLNKEAIEKVLSF
ncbi:MAG: insulinase family protein [Candidatus Taylorbacteria bacterium]|nr:insulinase family protein [Candidatus Taylorbacteria bacterium]